MNRRDWLNGEHPGPMVLTWLSIWPRTEQPLKRWVNACRDVWSKVYGNGGRYSEQVCSPSIQFWADSVWDTTTLSFPARALLLRECAGDPFVPVEPLWPALPDLLATLGKRAAQEIAGHIASTGDLDAITGLLDCLQDAGVDPGHAVVRHLLGFETCPKLCDHGLVSPEGEGQGWDVCGYPTCQRGEIPLRHPHVRQCWALVRISEEA